MQIDAIPSKLSIPAAFRYSAFYDLLADAVFQHQQAKQAADSYTTSRFARASVLASALSVECTANCLLASLSVSKPLLKELDKLTPMAKIEAYLKLRGIDGFDRGRHEVQRIAELTKARNDHVHPKTVTMPVMVSTPQDGGADWLVPFSLEGEHWNHLQVPKQSMFWSHTSSLAALGALASFFTYLFVDLLKASSDELHVLLQSRLEIENMHMPAIFNEIREELTTIAEQGVDFSFLGFLLDKGDQ